MTYVSRPLKDVSSASGRGPIREFCVKIAIKKSFDNFILVCIILNTIVLALKWYDQPSEMEAAFTYINIVFNIIFTIEAVIKIIALRSQYFRDAWNCFDFTIVVLSYIFLILAYTNVLVGFGSTTTILRALRIGRVLRLIKKAKKL